MKKIPFSIAKKITHLEGRNYCACLTPTEIVTLLNYGVKSDNQQEVKRIEKKKKQGKNDPSWFYFCLDRDQL